MTRVFRGVMVLVVILLLVLVLSPVTGNPVGKARDQVGNRLGTGRIAPAALSVTALADPGQASSASAPGADRPTGNGPLSALSDDVRATAWSAPWGVPGIQEPATGEHTCGDPIPQLGPVGFVVTFRQPTDVRQIGFESGGLGDTQSPDEVRSVLPATVELVWTSRGDDGMGRTACHRITLQRSTALQRADVDEGLVEQVTVRVVDGWLPSSQDGALVLRVGELTFWQR